MTNDEILDGFRDLFQAAHENADNLPSGPVKTRGRRLLLLFHAAANEVWDHFGDHGVVQPFDGTNKPPGP